MKLPLLSLVSNSWVELRKTETKKLANQLSILENSSFVLPLMSVFTG